MALPPIVITAVWLQLTTHLSNPRWWKAELAQLADPQQTVYPYKWLPISCRSGAGQGKSASQRPTFFHWATPLTSVTWWHNRASDCETCDSEVTGSTPGHSTFMPLLPSSIIRYWPKGSDALQLKRLPGKTFWQPTTRFPTVTCGLTV